MLRYLGITVLAVTLWGTAVEPARAQWYGYNPYVAQYQMQQMQMQSYYMYNLQNMWAANAAYTASAYNPMAYGGAGGMYGGGAGYSPNYNPYYYSPAAGYLFGSADVIRAEGDYTNAMEKARLLREQVEQSKLDTKKKAFELNLYIRQNTPTYAEQQAMATRQVLRRVQTTTNPFEIWNGVGLNVLLDDLKKFQSASISVVPEQVKPDILRQINITKSGGNFGLFRDDGQFQWPSALQDILGDKQKTISNLAATIIPRARNGKIENGLIKDLREEIEQARTALVKKITEIPTPQYIEAKRFLRDLDDACYAIGDAKAFFEFQNFVKNGKTVKEVSDYLITNGLRFAPAVQGGEAAYTAFHTALVNLDVAVNQQVAGAAPPSASSKDR
jgi:hypothetical protein